MNSRAVTRNINWKPRFLKKLSETGNVTLAAKFASISKKTSYSRRRDDPEFAEAWRTAIKEARDVLHAEAWRRAVRGVKEPVFHQGKVVGHVQRYSDTMLIFLMKAADPKAYRENFRIQHTGANGGPIETKNETTLDLSRLSTDELRTLRTIATRAAEPGRN